MNSFNPRLEFGSLYTTLYDPFHCLVSIVFGSRAKATQQLITRVPESTAVDIHSAVTSAELAQKAWRRLPLSKRRKHLLRLIELIRSHESDLVSRSQLSHVLGQSYDTYTV